MVSVETADPRALVLLLFHFCLLPSHTPPSSHHSFNFSSSTLTSTNARSNHTAPIVTTNNRTARPRSDPLAAPVAHSPTHAAARHDRSHAHISRVSGGVANHGGTWNTRHALASQQLTIERERASALAAGCSAAENNVAAQVHQHSNNSNESQHQLGTTRLIRSQEQ